MYRHNKTTANANVWCAPVVRKIYELYLDGKGVHRIAAALRAEKIPKPAAIAAEYFNNTYASHISTDMDIYDWRDGAVSTILTNPVYAGHIHRTEKSKKSGGVRKEFSIVLLTFQRTIFLKLGGKMQKIFFCKAKCLLKNPFTRQRTK